jgi:hypothetical protein
MSDILEDLDDLFEQAEKVESTIEEVKEVLKTETIVEDPRVEIPQVEIPPETKEEVDKKVDKTNGIIKKYEKIAEAFDVKVEDMSEDIEEIIEETKSDIVKHQAEKLPVSDEIKESAFNIDLLTEDFASMRETIKSSLENGRQVQQKYTDEIMINSVTEISPTVLMGFSELMKAVAKQVELLSRIYKDVAETQVKLKTYMKKEQMVEDTNGSGTTNIQQNNYIMSTQDLIDKFKVD